MNCFVHDRSTPSVAASSVKRCVPGVCGGGLAIGSIAIGGAAVGFMYAIGGGAFGRAVIDGRRCFPEAIDFIDNGWVAVIFRPAADERCRQQKHAAA